jgi:hypothetical protein
MFQSLVLPSGAHNLQMKYKNYKIGNVIQIWRKLDRKLQWRD